MTQQSATIKVLCRTEALQDAARMLQWALGHRVSIVEEASDAKTGCLFVFTDIEYYGSDTALFEKFGFNMIGKISGVVSWEILEPRPASGVASATKPPQNEQEIQQTQAQLETELMQKLCVLPITISIMPRMEGKFAWKCLEAEGSAETFAQALEAALTHLTHVFKLIRSELMA